MYGLGRKDLGDSSITVQQRYTEKPDRKTVLQVKIAYD